MNIELRIENHFSEFDAPHIHAFTLAHNSDWKSIVEWYAAFAAGDPIKVFLNDVEQELDINHCIATRTIGGGKNYVTAVDVTNYTKSATTDA